MGGRWVGTRDTATTTSVAQGGVASGGVRAAFDGTSDLILLAREKNLRMPDSIERERGGRKDRRHTLQ